MSIKPVRSSGGQIWTSSNIGCKPIPFMAINVATSLGYIPTSEQINWAIYRLVEIASAWEFTARNLYHINYKAWQGIISE